jgi:uncharacterized OsmC-like protein
MATATATERTLINGIDVQALRDTIEAIKADPRKGDSAWSITSRWRGGTRSDHFVNGFGIGGQHVDRNFVIRVDEPCELLGSNEHPNPQEYLLAAMNACMMVGYTAVASVMGVTLTRLEVKTTGDIDLRGFLGIDESVAPGYEKLEQTVTIAGDGTPEQFAKIHEVVHRTSPNYFNITHAIAVNSRLVVA